MALRRNFPERVEARRRRAAERIDNASAVYASELQTGSRTQGKRTSPEAPKPGTASACEPMQKLRPVPPTLRKFGLSEQDLSHLPKFWFRDLTNVGAREFWSYIVADLAIFWLIFGNGIKINFSWLMGFLFFSFVSFVPFLIFWMILGSLEKGLYRLFNERFTRYSNYQLALTSYRVKLAVFEVHLAKQQAEYWRSLSGSEFEAELGRLFRRMGYDVNETPRTADGGVDLILRKKGLVTIVQCKAHAKRVSIGVARELSACILDFEANDAIIACFEGVTKPVTDYIRNKPIAILTLKEIVAYQREYG